MSNRPPSTPAPDAQASPQAAIRLSVPDPLPLGATVALSPAQAHYLGSVMRRGKGDHLRLFNGRDGEVLASITDLRRERCLVTLEQVTRPQTPEPDIYLGFALLKRGPTELIVQKATELGAAALFPLFTTRTNADRTNITRLQAIATEAAEQCERLTVPVVHPPRALNVLLSNWPAGRPLIACFERDATDSLHGHQKGPLGLLIGPEGGFTDAELDAVRAHPFVEAVTLGPRVLRAETAAIVGLALIQAA